MSESFKVIKHTVITHCQREMMMLERLLFSVSLILKQGCLSYAGFRPKYEIIGKFRTLKKFHGHFVKRQK